MRTLRPLLQTLEDAFAQPFAIIDTTAGEIVFASGDSILYDCGSRMELLAEVARRGRVEVVEDEAPMCVIAAPLDGVLDQSAFVAVATFLTRPVAQEAELASAARVLGVDASRAYRWAEGREIWSPRQLTRLAEATLETLRQKRQLANLSMGMNEALAHARDTYIELGLLHRLSRRLHVSDNEEDLWRHALRWLSDSVPAQALAIVDVAASCPNPVIWHGEPPLSDKEVLELVGDVEPRGHRLSFALNRSDTSHHMWRFPAVRELACVPIQSGGRVRAWLLALNHRGGAELCEFGSVEVRLLDSIAAILAIHSSNTDLFKRQGDLFLSAVASLASTIDAKDHYTSGHSDRVARLSVVLAENLGLSREELDSIYLGGLLHDIGKIGIDDRILNKPDKLTDEEFEHIKQHPRLGFDILKGIEQFEKILPIVLHHHEAWNGRGYPLGLVGEETPLLARIVAVADSFDAMSSDRPYRPGMPLEKVESILRGEAGKQWDPAVIEAYFASRDEFQKIVLGIDDQCCRRQLDPAEWIR